MYLPDHFAEERAEVLRQLIAAHPLGTLVTLGPDGLTADHIPFLLEPRSGEHGALIGHVARNNPLWHAHDPAVEVLVVFQGPSAYISPNWYPTKQATHQVVPTYNYAVVHVHGPLVVHREADMKWLRGVVGRLTKRMEAVQPAPWKMADAPSDYLAGQLANIVGVEIPIRRITGKWKTSQNRIPTDRAGVVAALRASGDPGDATMAELVQASLSEE
jgi:transcriptional regulator